MDVANIRKKARAPKAPAQTSEMEAPALRAMPGIQMTTAVSLPPELSGAGAETILDPLEEFFSSSAGMLPLAEATASPQVSSGSQVEQETFGRYLTFFLGDEEYALDIVDIREIIKPREITDIPRVPDFILGIISLRGIILPVFDLKKRLNLGTTEMTSLSRIVVCQFEDRIVGLLVDSITQVVRLSQDRIEPPPAVLSGMDRDLVEGVGRHEGRMMVLLHLPCVMNAELV